MFTTLTVIKSSKTNAAKKGFFKRRKFISEPHQYQNCQFYSSRLLTDFEDNLKSIERFGVNAEMPIITNNSPLVKEYKYITLTNTVLANKNIGIIGIYDPLGILEFLPPRLARFCSCISVFTLNPTAYLSESDTILKDSGTPIVISENTFSLFRCGIIFASEKPTSTFACPIYGEGGIMPTGIYSSTLCKLNLPYYCNPFSVAAGLYFIEGLNEFGNLKCHI